MSEINQNPMPEIRLFPRLEGIGRVISRLIGFLPFDAPDYMSDHYDPLASPVKPVTSHTWHYPELPEDKTTIAYWREHHEPDDIYDPVQFVLNRTDHELGWDSEGNYHADDLATITPLFPNLPKDAQ